MVGDEFDKKPVISGEHPQLETKVIGVFTFNLSDWYFCYFYQFRLKYTEKRNLQMKFKLFK